MSKSAYEAWSDLHRELRALWCAINKPLALYVLWVATVVLIFVALVVTW